jgi:hypothetical protein
MDYGLDSQGFISSMDKRFFFLVHSIQIGSGILPALYPLGSRGSSPVTHKSVFFGNKEHRLILKV